MPTYIKTGYWDSKSKAPDGWLDLNLFVQTHGGGGGGTNPTSTFIPYNNGGTFDDSYLKNDSGSNILNTVYVGNDVGLKLDFSNQFYTLGDINNNTFVNVVGDSSSYIQIKSENPSTWEKGSLPGVASQVKTGWGNDSVSLASGDYTIQVPGVYIVTQGDLLNKLIIPAASLWKGQSITIVNADPVNGANIDGDVQFRGTNTLFTGLPPEEMVTLYSAGGRWWFAGQYQ